MKLPPFHRFTIDGVDYVVGRRTPDVLMTVAWDDHGKRDSVEYMRHPVCTSAYGWEHAIRTVGREAALCQRGLVGEIEAALARGESAYYRNGKFVGWLMPSGEVREVA